MLPRVINEKRHKEKPVFAKNGKRALYGLTSKVASEMGYIPQYVRRVIRNGGEIGGWDVCTPYEDVFTIKDAQGKEWEATNLWDCYTFMVSHLEDYTVKFSRRWDARFLQWVAEIGEENIEIL